MKPISFARHRFPPDIIRHGVWLYFRFTLSFRDVEDLLAGRGIDVSYETIRCWTLKFGSMIARNLRRSRLRLNGVWHLDEMIVAIGGQRIYLWRAVDRKGEVLDMLVQKRRNTAAALRLKRKLMKHRAVPPDTIVTDGLGSYAAAADDLGCRDKHRPGRLQENNRREQQSGKLSSAAAAAAREEDAAVQITGIRAKISLNPRRRLQHLQRPAPYDLSPHASSLSR
jgi:transposase-like protein